MKVITELGLETQIWESWTNKWNLKSWDQMRYIIEEGQDIGPATFTNQTERRYTKKQLRRNGERVSRKSENVVTHSSQKIQFFKDQGCQILLKDGKAHRQVRDHWVWHHECDRYPWKKFLPVLEDGRLTKVNLGKNGKWQGGNYGQCGNEGSSEMR